MLEVNPDDFELVRDARRGARRAASAASAGSTSSPSAASSRGGCIVRTEEGEIDARIGAQLERLRRAPAEAAAGARSPARGGVDDG